MFLHDCRYTCTLLEFLDGWSFMIFLITAGHWCIFCWLLLHWVQLLQSESTTCSTGDDRCMCPISDVLGIPKRKSVKYWITENYFLWLVYFMALSVKVRTFLLCWYKHLSCTGVIFIKLIFISFVLREQQIIFIYYMYDRPNTSVWLICKHSIKHVFQETLNCLAPFINFSAIHVLWRFLLCKGSWWNPNT